MTYYSHAITNDHNNNLAVESYKLLQNFDRVTLLRKRPLGSVAW